MAWTDERIALLKQYWEEGRSASQIAELLGEGLSRNAVIGKAHRLGLASRPSPLKTGESKAAEPRATEPRATEPKPARAPARAAARPAAPAPAAERPVARPEPAPAPVQQARPAAPPAPSGPSIPAEPGLAYARPAEPARAAPSARGKGGKVTLLDLNDRICKWPIGHPDEPDFHFCGKPVNPGFPYCGEHCLVAYQAQLPRRDRPAGPARPFGPNLPRPR